MCVCVVCVCVCVCTVVASNTAVSHPAGARRLGKASIGLSVAGVFAAIIVISVVVTLLDDRPPCDYYRFGACLRCRYKHRGNGYCYNHMTSVSDDESCYRLGGLRDGGACYYN